MVRIRIQISFVFLCFAHAIFRPLSETRLRDKEQRTTNDTDTKQRGEGEESSNEPFVQLAMKMRRPLFSASVVK